MTLSVIQKKAIEKLNRLKVGALFMEPGTGKTRTAIELINGTAADWVLWLTPYQNKANLEVEIKKWNFNLPYQIAGIESLSSADRLYLELLNRLQARQHPFIVLDESLKIKNRDAIRTQRIIKLGEISEYRLILNGTPISKNILDLWSQMQFLSPKILGMGFNEFKDTFVEYVRYQPAGGGRWLEFIDDYHNLDYLYSLISPFVYDAKLELDKNKRYISVEYWINDYYQDYQDIKNYYLSNVMWNQDPNIFLAMTQQMQQAYCTETRKFELVKKLLTPKTIIFCKFIKSRMELQERFPKTKVLTYGKGSLGLNLQAYNQIIFFDKTFNYAQREQAERRIYRIGQQTDCRFVDLTGDIGLEKFIDTNIQNKTTLLDAFKRAAKNNKTEAILNEL